MVTRRSLIGSAAAVSVAAILTRALRGEAHAAAESKAAVLTRSASRVRGFDNPELDFQLMRSLGAATSNGGTPGEIFHAVTAIGEDAYAWPPAFAALAKRVDQAGQEAAGKDRRVSARDYFLRASMYWRAAEYFSDPFQPVARERGLASRVSFMRAAALMDDRIEAVEIPFEGVTLPGYFMTPARGGNGRTLIVLTGFDGTGEELYFETARAGLERGFTILAAEGPGQAGTMRFHPDLPFRPDYEKPIGAMIDFALRRSEVDAARLALYGISMGGYFATRAAAHDRRIRAVILNSPVPDLKAYLLGFLGGPDAVAKMPPLPLSAVDSVPDGEMPRTAKLAFKMSCRRFGVTSLHEWIDVLARYTAVADLGRITCPALALAGAGEGGQAAAQIDIFSKGVSGPVTRRIFTVEEGADMHCQLGNLPVSNAAVYDWLTDVL